MPGGMNQTDGPDQFLLKAAGIIVLGMVGVVLFVYLMAS
jgi:hypothetical protein